MRRGDDSQADFPPLIQTFCTVLAPHCHLSSLVEYLIWCAIPSWLMMYLFQMNGCCEVVSPATCEYNFQLGANGFWILNTRLRVFTSYRSLCKTPAEKINALLCYNLRREEYLSTLCHLRPFSLQNHVVLSYGDQGHLTILLAEYVQKTSTLHECLYYSLIKINTLCTV